MDSKWFAIMVMVMFLAMFGILSVDSIATSKCKAAAIAAHAAPEIIDKCE